jgi:hypothetical protein
MKVFYTLLTILMLMSVLTDNLSAQVSEQDSLALVALYDSTDGDKMGRIFEK